jgi:hypothetical protein
VTTRFIIRAGIVLTLACLGAPIAAAGGWAPPGQAGGFDGRSPDTKDAAMAAHHGSRVLSASGVASTRPTLNGTGFDGRSPDTKDAALAAHQGSRTPAIATTSPATRSGAATPLDGRSPDTRDAALAAHGNSTGTYNVATGYASPPLTGAGFDGRSQDTKDAALAAHNPAATVVIATADGFDWTDAGIGAAAGFGLALMLAAGLTLTRKETTVAAS